jgi:uncharacterized membrane protein/protein-disulfide isomerase
MRTTGRTALHLVLILAAGGAAWVGYALHLAHLRYNMGAGAGGFLCRDHGLFNCNEIAGHVSAWPWGFPLSLVGVAFYVVLAYLALVAGLYRGPDRKAILALGTVVSGLAVVFLLYLAFVMVVFIRHLCPTALVLCGLTIVTFLVFRVLDRDLREPVRWSRVLPSPWLWRGGRADLHRDVFKIGMLVVLLLAGGVTLNEARAALRLVEASEETVLNSLAEVIMDPPAVDVSLLASSKSVGPQDADLTFVLAGDYEDHRTRTVAQELGRLQARWPEGIRFVFVHLPLDQACNPAVAATFNANACWLAQGAECALEQGKFWEYHRYLTEVMPRRVGSEQTVLPVLEEIGIDRDQFEACMASGAPREAVLGETRRCAAAGIEMVPTLVVNGHAIWGVIQPRILQRVARFFRYRAEGGIPETHVHEGPETSTAPAGGG